MYKIIYLLIIGALSNTIFELIG